MRRSIDRMLTTHAGSLVRTPELIGFMRKIEAGEPYDEAAYEEALRRGVADVVRRQAQVQVDVVSDGEYGKRGWLQYVTERLSGFELRDIDSVTRPPRLRPLAGPDRERFAGFYAAYDRLERTLWLPPAEDGPAEPPPRRGVWACTGPVAYTGQAALERDIANLKAAMPGPHVIEAFMASASPGSIEAVRLTNDYYPSDEAYLYAIADAMLEEYRAITDAGLVLQIDDPFMPATYARMLPDVSIEAYRRYCELRIEALNHALAGIPENRIRYHICWGSQNVPHTTDVPLSQIIDLVFRVNAGAYSIEAANPRHEHEFQIWDETKLAEGKVLIPGVISHATNIVEHPELVAWRILNFARPLGRENVIAGTDCGFSQSWNSIRVHPEVQWAKLAALSEGAWLMRKALWPRT